MAAPSDLNDEIIALPLPGTRPQDATAASRRRVEAMSLRLAGLTDEQIGDRFAISKTGARDLIDRTLARAENRNVVLLRTIENARLDREQAAIWQQVIAGDLKVVDTFLRISVRRAKLNALDAPMHIKVGISIRQEMESALAELERVVLGEVGDVPLDTGRPRPREQIRSLRAGVER